MNIFRKTKRKQFFVDALHYDFLILFPCTPSLVEVKYDLITNMCLPDTNMISPLSFQIPI